MADDLKVLELPTNMHELEALCFMRGSWRSIVYEITHPGSVGIPYQRSRAAAQRQQGRLAARAQQLMPQFGPLTAEQQAAYDAAMAMLAN